MPSRGGPQPELGLGGVGQQAQAQVPGLLQMAQAAMDGGGGDVRGSGLAFGGGPGFAPGGGGGGGQHYGSWVKSRDDDAIVRALTTFSGGSGDQFRGGPGGGSPQISPEDKARYFDASGGYKLDDPRQVAAEGGISPDQLRQGFLPRYGYNGQGYDYPSDKGGFFSIEALSRLGGQPVPGMATHGQHAPSTNNWRLLGMGPGWIMRNGSLINTQMGSVFGGGHHGTDMGTGITGEHGMGVRRGSALGTGAAHGTPNQWGDAFYWPGAATGGFADRWPAGTNV